MKKTISILLILTMLLSMIVVSAMPASAAEDVPQTESEEATVPSVEELDITAGITSEATGANEATAGNTLTKGANTATYKNDSEWTAVSNETEFLAMQDNKNYYLTADIKLTKTHGGYDSGLEGQAKDRIDNWTLDGNGYTLTFSQPIFNMTNNITIKNLTLKGSDFEYNYGKSGGDARASALERWGSSGYAKLENVTCTLNIDVTYCASSHQVPAGFIYRTYAGSEFKNVKYTGIISVDTKGEKDVAKLLGSAGMVAIAEGTTFDNCITNGKIVVNGDPYKECVYNDCGIGGLAGKATGSSTIKNCTNNMEIVVNAPANTTSGKTCRCIGGLVGFSNSGTTFYNCVNNGNITLNSAATEWFIGGIVGHVCAGIGIDTCANNGDITAPESKYASGILGYSNTATKGTTINNCKNTGNVSGKLEVGGMVGYSNGGNITITNCTNLGNISSAGWVVGGIGGYVKDSSTITNCVNGAKDDDTKGIITGGKGSYVGGISGATDKVVKLQECINYGDVTAAAGAAKVGGITAQIYGSGTIYKVANYGDVTAKGACNRVGGIVGDVTASSFTYVQNWGNVTAVAPCFYVGGITGEYNVGSADNVYNCGDVTLTGDSEGDWVRVAGIAGLSNATSWTNSGNYGDVYYNGNDDNGIFVAGLVAIDYTAATFQNCVNAGDITSIGTSGNHYGVGGFEGWTNQEKTFRGCENSGDVSGRVAAGYVGFLSGGGSDKSVVKIDDCSNSGDITATAGNAGGFVATVAKAGSTFEGCSNSGDITATGNAAGIVAESSVAISTIDDCHNSGDVISTGSSSAAGIVARSSKSITITNSTNTGNMTTNFVAGGIGGYLNGGGTVKNCVNGDANDPTKGAVIGAKDGATYIAGIGGALDKSAIDSCTNYGPVSANGAMKIGGISGQSFEGSSITNCHNAGTVTNTNGFAGGIIGQLTRTINAFSGNSNSGTITGTTYVGGIIGALTAENVIDAVTNTGAVVAPPQSKASVGGIVGAATAKLTVTDSMNDGPVVAIGNATTDGVRGAGGFVGCIFSNAENSFTNCVNTENGVVIQSVVASGTQHGSGGFVGRINGESGGGYANQRVSFVNCQNAGDVINYTYLDYEGTELTTNYTLSTGGFVGQMYSAPHVDFTNCVNSGDVVMGDSDINNNYRGAGGFVGMHRCLGQSWIQNFTETDLTFTNCINEGNVEGVYHAGGFVGRTIDITRNYNNYTTTTFNNCLNTGTITALWAGGMIGYNNSLVEYRLNDVINAGVINGSNGGAGVIANIYNGEMYIEGSVNAGSIDSTYAAGFVAYANDPANIEVRDSFSVGTLVANNIGTLNPVGHNIDAYSGNLYSANAVDVNDYDEADFMPVAEVEAAMASVTAFYGYGLDRLNELVEAVKDTDGADIYSAYTWNAFNEALEYAKSVQLKERFKITYVDGEPVVEMLSQGEVNKAYADLAAAYEGLTEKGAVAEAVQQIADEAEALLDKEALYTASSWKAFTDACTELETAFAQVSDFDAIDPKMADEYIVALRAAIDALVEGGEISTAEEFAALNGATGTYILLNDITIEAPVESFAGTLIGNGKTITVKNCAVFNNLNGATVVDLRVKGNAGEAKSLFGKAEGEVAVTSVIVNVEKLAEAALFNAAAEDAKITAKYVISYADAGVAALVGNVGCEVEVAGALVVADAPALVGTAADSSEIKHAYLEGAEYYGSDAKKTASADILASGKVAYEMNIYLNKYAIEVDTAFIDIPMLVQVVGTDAAPVVGTPNMDRSNVVKVEYDRNNNILGYGNDKVVVEGGQVVAPEMPEIKPAALVFDMLNSAIARAEALVADGYTEASWAVLTTALANAKAALNATVQDTIDNATNALNVAVAGLKVKPAEVTPVDYSKLDAVIAQAEALNAADYTDGSWATVVAMLAKAKIAKTAADQTSVDAARAALNSAILNLVKATPKTTEAPSTTDKPATTEPADDKGCGSVIGGAAVILTAVVALGMGISFKKKED